MQEPTEDHHKELSNLGTAMKLAYWRYGRRLGVLCLILVVASFITGNRDAGWWYQLPHPWTGIVGWGCLILFWVFAYMIVRNRPGKQSCIRCNAPFRKISFTDAKQVGSMDRIWMKCEACGYEWFWQDSPS
jgi:hypothetical protein